MCDPIYQSLYGRVVRKLDIKDLPDDILARCIEINGHLIWRGCVHKMGYGQIKRSYVTYKVHRVICEAYHGKPTDGQHALHSCDIKLCCNPEHLRWGTHDENMQDKVDRNRQSRLTGERNGRAKLNKDLADQIRARFESGMNKSELSREFDISRSQIRKIVGNEIWV